MIIIHNENDANKMRTAGKIAAQLLNELCEMAKPGVATIELDEHAKKFMEKNKVRSACYGYQGVGKIPFPGFVCTSVNHVICHGIPSNYVLKEGDVVGIDLAIEKDNYYADTCKTVGVGNISKENQELLNAAKTAMEVGIQQAQKGKHLGHGSKFLT